MDQNRKTAAAIYAPVLMLLAQSACASERFLQDSATVEEKTVEECLILDGDHVVAYDKENW